MKCEFLNKDNTCNSTAICHKNGCAAFNSNYANVENKAKACIERGETLLADLSKSRGKVQ